MNVDQDSRHISRLLAVQYLFTEFKSQQENQDYLVFEPNALLQVIEEKKFNIKLYENIIDGVHKFQKDIDKVIEEIAPAWPLDQINPVNLTILRIAIWEGFISNMTPPKVVINEAIELDKSLSSTTNSTFINGVLGNIFNNTKIKQKLSNLNIKKEKKDGKGKTKRTIQQN